MGKQRKTEQASRRTFLKAGVGLAAGGAAVQALPTVALAQGGPDTELSRLQGQRRILLKGGIVLTLDRQVGDFTQADVLIEDGKIREIRPNIAAAGECRGNRRCIESDHRPRLHRHAQPFLSGHPAQHPGKRPRRSGLQPRHYRKTDAGLHPRGRLYRDAGLGARSDRNRHDRRHRRIASQQHARAQ
jgi:hypothetical protein